MHFWDTGKSFRENPEINKFWQQQLTLNGKWVKEAFTVWSLFIKNVLTQNVST